MVNCDNIEKTSDFAQKHYSLKQVLKTDFEKQLNFTVDFVNVNGSVAMHDHDFTELVIVLEGTAIHKIEGREIPLEKGNVFVMGAKESHEYINCKDFLHCNILFNAEYLIKIKYEFSRFFGMLSFVPKQKNNAHYSLTNKYFTWVTGLLEIIEWELKNEKSDCSAAYQYFLSLLNLIFRCIDIEKVNIDNLFYNSLKFIEKNYSKRILLTDLAKLSAMSERNYQRIFKRVYNMSPTDYIMNIRINKAAELIKLSNLTLSQIAENTGFYDSSTLCRYFKRFFGITPSCYKEMSKQLNNT